MAGIGTYKGTFVLKDGSEKGGSAYFDLGALSTIASLLRSTGISYRPRTR
jgi:hypothetical protein